MGCTQRGVKVEESDQLYMWGQVGITDNQKYFGMDLYTADKTGEFCTKIPKCMLCSLVLSHDVEKYTNQA